MKHSNIQLPPHQQRVIEEQKELLERLAKLRCFLETEFFKTLSEEDQKDLEDQDSAMLEYYDILTKRISKF